MFRLNSLLSNHYELEDSKSPLKLKLQGDTQRNSRWKLPLHQVLGTKFCPLWKWNGLSWSVILILSPKGLTLLFSHHITSFAPHLAAWWATSVLRQSTLGREKENRTQLPINNLCFSWFWFLPCLSFSFWWGYLRQDNAIFACHNHRFSSQRCWRRTEYSLVAVQMHLAISVPYQNYSKMETQHLVRKWPG